MSDEDEQQVQCSTTNPFHDMNNRRLTGIQLKLQELTFKKTKRNVDILQSEIDHLSRSIADINKEIIAQINIKKTLNEKMTILRSNTGLRYTNLQTALRDKESYEKELEKSNKSETYQDLARQQIKSISEVLPQLQQQDEYQQKFRQAEEMQFIAQEKREELEERLNIISREQAELKQLLNNNKTRLSQLEADASDLEGEEPSVSDTPSELKKQDSTTEEYFEPPTRVTEHVQLVKRQMPTTCITVEPGSSCCFELVGLRLECDDERFINKGMTSNRNINVYVGVLGTKCPENNNLQIVPFRGSFDCISKVLSMKEKLIYLIMSNASGKSVVPLIHKHRCVEYIYILQNTDDQKQVDWIKDYSKIRRTGSSIELLLELVTQDINSLMQRPSRWSRSKTLLTELCLQTCQTNLWASIEDTPKEDVSMSRIITLFFGSRQLFPQSQSQIQIDEFNNVDECIQSMKAQVSTTVFLIVSTDGSDDIRSLFELDTIHAVYIVWNGNCNERIETWLQHTKISGVFGLDEDLLEQLTTDICFYRHIQFHSPMINIFQFEPSIIDNPNDQQIRFLFFQLFSDILPHIPSAGFNTETDNLFTALLIDANVAITHLFDQFDSFTLQKSVPQLRKMNQCIASLSTTVDSPPVTVYRAQLVTKKDLETMQNNTDIFLSIRTFVFTSRSLRTVIDICRRAIDNQLTVILFEFNLSENMMIANLDSDIVVFSTDTVFRLNSIECAVDGVWHAQLESADGAMQRIKDQLQSKIGGRLTWLTFGNYLVYLKQFRAAKEYSQYLLSILPGNYPGLASVYNNIGLICSAMNDDQEALHWFEKALSSNLPNSSTTVNMVLPQDTSTSRVAILSKMAEISCRLGDPMTALDFYRQACEITTDVNLRHFYQEKILALTFVNNS